MEYDFAILYFGLTRSTKKVYKSHIDNVFDILTKHNLTYKTFMHTWDIGNNPQNINGKHIPQKIDYDEYKLLHPDFYKIESQQDFINNLDMNNYFYKEVWDKHGDNRVHGEWPICLIRNHLCALESKKRGMEMIENFVDNRNRFKYVMFLRPDVMIHDTLPLDNILLDTYEISIPDNHHYEGYNDRFAIIIYEKAGLYGKRIDEIIEYRKKNGRIVSEKYVKFIVNKYSLKINLLQFRFDLIRP